MIRPLHLLALAAGAAAAAWGLTLLREEPARTPGSVPAPSAAPLAAPGRAGPASQIEVLGGPGFREPEPGRSAHGAVKTDAAAEAERRKEGLREVLDRLEGSPVYVEGVDGPSRR